MNQFIQLLLAVAFSFISMEAASQTQGFRPKRQNVGDSIPKCTAHSKLVGPCDMIDGFTKEGVHYWICPVCKKKKLHEKQCKPERITDSAGNIKYRCSLHKDFDFMEVRYIDGGKEEAYFYCEYSKYRYKGILEKFVERSSDKKAH